MGVCPARAAGGDRHRRETVEPGPDAGRPAVAGGFLTIGGDWFRMWANEDVNASSAAPQNFLIAGVGMILVHLARSAEAG